MSDPTYHKDAAEQLLGYAQEIDHEDRGSGRETSLLREAQVHATLAMAPDYSVQMGELLRLREKVANLRAMLPTEAAPEQGLPNELAYANGWYGAWDMVREELDRGEASADV